MKDNFLSFRKISKFIKFHHQLKEIILKGRTGASLPGIQSDKQLCSLQKIFLKTPLKIVLKITETLNQNNGKKYHSIKSYSSSHNRFYIKI